MAKFGNLWHSVPNGIFVKRQCWRGLAYRFAQIYLAKNFYRRKRKRGGLVPPPWFDLVTPSNRHTHRVHDFRRSDRHFGCRRTVRNAGTRTARYSAFYDGGQ
ncbi:hypothetical protein D7O18_14730 [Salmonella enterica subsp. enterica serovar Muenchen]|nr:hypothetical protein [Salmonella enterica subsp. enterica serovar Muenchen]